MDVMHGAAIIAAGFSICFAFFALAQNFASVSTRLNIIQIMRLLDR